MLEFTVFQQTSGAIVPDPVTSTATVSGSVSKAGAGKQIVPAGVTSTTTIVFHPPDVVSTTVVTAQIHVAGFQQIVPAAVTSTATVAGAVTVLVSATGGYQSQRTEGFAHVIGFPL